MGIGANELLVLVDIQNDFCPGGALAVPEGDQMVAAANRLIGAFPHSVLTQDWHPPTHHSFASAHEGAEPFAQISVSYGPQTLWPDHCVQGSPGARFHPDLNTGPAELVVRKGFRPSVDSYSAFFENDRVTPTGLAGYVRERAFSKLYFAGLATDFCVGFSALDAVRCGFEAIVVEDACRAIDLGGSLEAMRDQWRQAGVRTVSANALS